MLILELGETIGNGLTRIARATLDRAVEHLAESPADVHNARKRFKELRAVLRLGHYAIESHFDEIDQSLHDAGSELAAIRDADARLATIASLREFARDRAERQALSRIRRILAAGQRAAPNIAEVEQRLSATRLLLAFDGGPEALERGLRRTYRAGRRQARAAHSERAPAAIHAWRKQVKYLWYQSQLLKQVWPKVLKPHIAALDDLSHLLGEHHDLFALTTFIDEDRKRIGQTTAQRLAAVVTRRIEEIEPAAFRIGALVFAERSRGWSTRLVQYWRAWTQTDEAVVE